MQDLEADLVSSEETVARHSMKLQNLDIVMQMVRAVAGELTSSGSEGPTSMASLADLRMACAQALNAE
jgi:hypothetical protein